jgi:hypothetical protein
MKRRNVIEAEKIFYLTENVALKKNSRHLRNKKRLKKTKK